MSAAEAAAFRALVDRSSCPMAILDCDGYFIYVNGAFARLFGTETTPDLFPDVDSATLLAPEAGSELRSDVLSVAAASGWEGRLRLLRKDRLDDGLFVRLSPVRAGSPDAESALLVAELVPDRLVSAAPVAARAPARDEGDIPVLPVATRVIVVPVIGELASRRSQLLLRRLLASISEHRAKVVIVDVTGLVNVDERAADYLAKAVLAARLKGAKTIVSGVSQETAEALTEINAEWAEITTVGQLEMGLAMALRDVSKTESRRRAPGARGGR